MLRWARGGDNRALTRDLEFVKQQWASLDPRTDSEGVRGLLCGMREGRMGGTGVPQEYLCKSAV